MGIMASRTGGDEGADRAFRSSEGAWRSTMCATAISAGGKTDAFSLEEGLEVELLSSGRALVRVPSTGSGVREDEEGGSILVRKGTDAGMLWS